MIKRVLAVTATAALVVGVVACGGDDGDEQSASGGKSTEPIVIGASTGLTGAMSFFDVPDLDGAKLAIEDINAAGGIDGRKLELVVDDNQSKADRFVPSARKVLESKPALLLVSNSDTTGTAAAKEADKAGVLSFGVSGPTGFGSPTGELVFNGWYGDPTEAAVLAEFANEKGWQSAYLVSDEALGYTKDMCDLFTKAYESWGHTVAGRTTFNSVNDTSFPSQVSQIRANASKADVIVVCGLPTGAPTLMKELRSAGVDLPILATGGALDGDYWTEAVPNLGEFYADAVPSSVFDNNPNEKQNALRERYGEDLSSGHIYVGYSMIEMFAEAVRRADGKTDGKSLAAALETLEDFPTMAGPTTYTKECHVPTGRTVSITRIVDGKGEWVKDITPDKAHIPKPDYAPC